jgi:hypothetical protein
MRSEEVEDKRGGDGESIGEDAGLLEGEEGGDKTLVVSQTSLVLAHIHFR